MKKVKIKIKRKNRSASQKAVDSWRKQANSNSDVLGWYTGVPSGSDEQPEQDGDDL
ncbi:MAG: hypothetical protein ACI4GY_07910 [Acutalibacteraceae bacterium]